MAFSINNTPDQEHAGKEPFSNAIPGSERHHIRKRTNADLDRGDGWIARTIRSMQSWTYSASMTFLLTLNLFFIIALVLAGAAVVGWVAVVFGGATVESIATPANVSIVMYAICIIIGVSEAVTIRAIILAPMKNMVAAVKRLAQGDYSVRVTCSGWMRPIELREFADSFNVAAESLASTELINRDFMNNYSHEFKTPITSIAGFADLLLVDDGLDAAERQEYLRIISSEAHRLSDLSNAVLALTRIEGRTTLEGAEPVDIAEQLREVLLELDRKWAAKGLSLEFDAGACDSGVGNGSDSGDEVDDEAPVLVNGNPAMLRQVWVNLIDNAMKFSEPGGRVRVCCQAGDDGAVAVRVVDEGQGMDAATQTHIFEQFYQGDTSHKTEGNGLGLALVAKVIELYRGHIEVESAPGNGTTFTVTLPAGQ